MRRFFKYVFIGFSVLLGLPFLLVALLYVPPVQRAVVRTVCSAVSDSAMQVSVGDFRLRFPLRLDVSDAYVMTGGDTLCALHTLHIEVDSWPLLRLVADVPDLFLEDVLFRYADTTGFSIDVRLDKASMASVSARLREESVDVGRIALSGGGIGLKLGMALPDTAETVDTVTTPLAWRFKVDALAVDDILYRMQDANKESFLTAGADSITVGSTSVDLGAQTVDVASLYLLAGKVSMIVDTSVVVPAEIPPLTNDDISEEPSLPWTVRAGCVRIAGTEAVYALEGHIPQPGFDADYMQISSLALAVDSVYNRGSDVAARLLSLSLVERSGLAVRDGKAFFSMDSAVVKVDGLHLTTDNSVFFVDLLADGSILSMDKTASLSTSIGLDVGLRDAALFLPGLDSSLSALPFDAVSLDMAVDGVLDSLRLARLYVDLPGAADFFAEGDIKSLTETDSLSAKMALTAHLDRLGFLPAWIGAEIAHEVSLPDSMSFCASLDFENEKAARVQLFLGALHGRLTLDADYAFVDTAYRIDTRWQEFPVGAFLPQENFGLLSLSLSARGCGFDPFSDYMRADLALYVDTLDYGGYRFNDLGLDAVLDSGIVSAHILGVDSAVRLDLNLSGSLSPAEYTAHLAGEIDWLDLKTARFTDDSLTLSSSVDIRAWANDKNEYSVKTRFDMMGLHLFDMDNRFEHIVVTGDMLRDSLDARIDFPGVRVAFSSPAGIDSFISRTTAFSDYLQKAVDEKDFVPAHLCALLPDFYLKGKLVPEQVVDKVLQENGLKLDSLDFMAENGIDSKSFGIEAEALGLSFSSFSTDTLTAFLRQDDELLRYAVRMGNTPETSELLAQAGVSGFIGNGEVYTALRQKDQKNEPGLVLDIDTRLSDSLLHITLGPDAPTLGVPDWSLNTGNFVDYYFDGRLVADLQLKHDVQSFSLQSGSQPGADTIYLDVENLRLAPILQTMPGTPPISALLSTALATDFSGGYPMVGGSIRLDSARYDGKWVGNMALSLDYRQLSSSLMEMDAFLDVDTTRALSLSARYDTDTLSALPLDATVQIPAFPLSVANAFLPDDMARIEGVLRGNVSASGHVDAPRLNGRLSIGNGKVDIPMIGASFRFSPAVVSMSDSHVSIDTFNILGPNNEPLSINGNVNLSDFSRPYLDANVNGHNFELFNLPKNRTSMLYGKAAADIDASVRGFIDALSLRGNIVLLNGTEATYVLRDNNSLPGVSNYGDMVVFTSFVDTASEETIVPFQSVSGMDMLVNVDIGNAVSLSVELTPDGNSRIDLQGGGSLTYTMNALGDSRFTGRYELSGGTVCYTPPLIGQKLFSIKEGSSVVWEGEMANPVLDITAIDKLQVDVASGGSTRSVQFQVSISITNSLDNLSIVFDVAAPNDLTIQNELTSMTAEQRASQAMSLLVYNTYTGPSASQGDLFSGNPLNQFLQNELNKWSRNNLKNVDLSFGINSKGEADGTTRTDYSYQLSKKFFNDRIRIVVGGSYSPDDNSADALKENLVDDIAIEYKLDKRDNMILKIFRHTGQETILEGEVTETGLGFAVRKKLARLSELFRRSSRRNASQTAQSIQP